MKIELIGKPKKIMSNPYSRHGYFAWPTVARGAGHHSVIIKPETDEYYIVYHRRPLGETNGNYRVTCIDKMTFDEKGFINPVRMTFQGVEPSLIKK